MNSSHALKFNVINYYSKGVAKLHNVKTLVALILIVKYLKVAEYNKL